MSRRPSCRPAPACGSSSSTARPRRSPARRRPRPGASTTHRSTAGSSPATSSPATAPPRASGASSGSAARFSPNGDDVVDTATITGNLSEAAGWTATIEGRRRDGTLETVTGTGDDFGDPWGGTADGGGPLPDGAYPVTVGAIDAWGNASATTGAGTAHVDTVAPDLAWRVARGRRRSRGSRPTATAARDDRLHGHDPGGGDARRARRRRRGHAGPQARPARSRRGSSALGWDGRDSDGSVVADGVYDVRYTRPTRPATRATRSPGRPRRHGPRVRDDVKDPLLPAGRRPRWPRRRPSATRLPARPR